MSATRFKVLFGDIVVFLSKKVDSKNLFSSTWPPGVNSQSANNFLLTMKREARALSSLSIEGSPSELIRNSQIV